MQINKWFFAFCFLEHQLNLASFNLNSKHVSSNLFSVLQPLKSFLFTFLIPLSSKWINHSFLGALIPVNILTAPYLMHFNLLKSIGYIKCDSLSSKITSRFLFFCFLISILVSQTQLQSFLPLNTSALPCLVSVLQHLKCFFRVFLDFF